MKKKKTETQVINRKKYSFKTHKKEYFKQFNAEKSRLLKILDKEIKIEHFGSTAVPGLGGKGIVDIIIEVPKKYFLKFKKILEQNGYDYKPHFRKRLFFKKHYKNREVHVHLTYLGTKEFMKEIAVRDYLINNKEEARKYENIKKKAFLYCQGIGQKYRDFKKSHLNKLEKRALKFYKRKD